MLLYRTYIISLYGTKKTTIKTYSEKSALEQAIKLYGLEVDIALLK